MGGASLERHRIKRAQLEVEGLCITSPTLFPNAAITNPYSLLLFHTNHFLPLNLPNQIIKRNATKAQYTPIHTIKSKKVNNLLRRKVT
jgi:hypothetical protein